MNDIRLPKNIPLFPLPGVLLLPGGILPLHIFEQRYRQLINESYESGQHFGIPAFIDKISPINPILQFIKPAAQAKSPIMKILKTVACWLPCKGFVVSILSRNMTMTIFIAPLKLTTCLQVTSTGKMTMPINIEDC